MTKKSKMIKLISLIALLVALVAIYFVVEKVNKEKEEETESENEEVSVTIHSTDVDSIVSFSYIYEGTEYAFQKVDDTWVSLNDESIELDQDAVSNLAENFQEVTASRIVEEEASDLTQYGLDNPTNVITVIDSEGNTVIYDIGNENQTVSGYYIKTEDNNTVYLTDTFATVFNKNLEDLKKEEDDTTSTEATTEDDATSNNTTTQE